MEQQRSPYKFADIQRATLAQFGIEKQNFLGRSARRKYSYPRFCAVYLARQWTALSLPQLGHLLKRDHTTILSAEKRARELIARDQEFRNNMAAVMARLQAEPLTVRDALQPRIPASITATWV